MARQTSIEAYNYLVESGKLAKMNRVVYQYLYQHGPTTQKKTEKALGDTTDTVVPRFAPLKRMGLIIEVGKVVCEETRRNNLLWDVTDRKVPLEDTRISLKEKKDIILDKLETHGKNTPEDTVVYKDELRDIYKYIRDTL